MATTYESLGGLLSDVRDLAQYLRTKTGIDTLRQAKMAMTYQVMAVLAGYGDDHQRDVNFHRHLGQSMAEDHGCGRAFSCSLIINKKLCMPGEQYFQAARGLGYKIGFTPAEERVFWEGQLRLMDIDPESLVVILVIRA
jgi:hypothetical protein